MQLVATIVSRCYDTMKDKRIGRDEVIEKFGVTPEKVIEVQALMGDTSDNMPGIPGIGPKAAATFIAELGSLNDIYKLKERPEAIDEQLTKTLVKIQSDIDKIAGSPTKVSSGTEIAKVLQSKFAIKDL